MHTTTQGSSRGSASEHPRVCVAVRWRQSRTAEAVHHAVEGGPTQSRLRVLRRRRTGRSAVSVEEVGDAHLAGADAHDAHAVAGIGMAPRNWPVSSPRRPMQVAVLTPYLALEGLTSTGESPGPSPPASRCSDAHLIGKLSELIATELVGHASPFPTPSGKERGGSVRNREVVTFAMGLQGSGKTSFLLGGLHSCDPLLQHTNTARDVPSPQTTASQPAATSSLFSAVLDRIFEAAPSSDVRGASTVAMSVVEVRDAAPLRHPSVLQRPRDSVDLLSGQHLLHQGREGEDGSSVVSSTSAAASSTAAADATDEPTDIPAACYVAVRSTAEAAQVLYTALRSSLAWQPAVPVGVDGSCTAYPASPPPPLLRPAGLPQEEKLGHVCITVLTRCPTGPRGEAARAAVGIWKLWDLAGPSLTCGYRPLRTTAELDAPIVGRTPLRENVSTGDTADAHASDVRSASTLPWHNRYSLPALTHTCLSDFGRRLAESAVPDVSFARCETAAQQIVASALHSCSLVVPVCAVVEDAVADAVNAEVLRCADGWTACGQQERRSGLACRDGTAGLAAHRRRCAEDNAVAAHRVLEDYTVPFATFVKESAFHGSEEPLSSAPAALSEESSLTWSSRERTLHPVEQSWEAEHGGADTATTTGASRMDTGSIPADRLAAAGSKQSGGTAAPPQTATAPLSINVTAIDESASSATWRVPSGRGGVPGVGSRTAVGALPETSAEQRCSELLPAASSVEDSTREMSRLQLHTAAVPAPQHDDQESVLPAQKSIAPSGDPPQHFSEVTATQEEALWTSHEVQALSDEEGGAVAVAAAAPPPQPTRRRELLRTPEKREGSPPTVMRTGLRGDAPAAPPPASIRHQPACQHVHRLSGAHVEEMPFAARSDEAGSCAACDAKQLHFGDVSELPAGAVARVDAAVGTDAAPHEDMARQPEAAVLHFLTPYCNQFTTLYETMRRDVAAWRASEMESLQAIAALSERHSEDIHRLAQLLQKCSATTPHLDASGVDVADTAAVSSDTTAAIATTSALIFQQLLRSEEKVTWLERQLVQWRQRTHEASSLQLSNLEETVVDDDGASSCSGAIMEGSRDGTGGGDDDHQPSALLEVSTGAVTAAEEGGDPTRRHVLKVQRILRRLLVRCGRAYDAAQRCSARWQEQVGVERASKAALVERVAELERELAAYRQRSRGSAAAVTRSPHRVSVGSADTPLWRHLTPDCSTSTPETPELREARPVVERSAATLHGSRREVYATAFDMSGREGDDGCGGAAVAASSATPAHVSPIRSPADTALSMPSPPDHQLWRPPQPRGASSATAASSTSCCAVVPTHLAALLGRAVDMGTAVDARGDQCTVSSQRPFATALFDVRVGPPSVSTVDVPTEVGGGVEEERPVTASSQRAMQPPAHHDSHSPYCSAPHASRTPVSFSAEWREKQSDGVSVSSTSDEQRALIHRSAESSQSRGASLVLHGHPFEVSKYAATYPTVALQRLQEAAAQLAANAVHLAAVENNQTVNTTMGSIEKAADLLRRTLSERQPSVSRSDSVVDRRVAAGGAEAGWPGANPLYASMSELRSASQAVQREAHEAAVRERAYLSTILFSPPSTPPRPSGGDTPYASTASAFTRERGW